MWCADIKQIKTGEGWLYLAAVQDLFSRRIVGWAMDCHMRSELVVAALQMAVEARRPAKGTIHHSDHGGQYIGLTFGQAAHDAGIAQSMGAVGSCFDNAVAETFFATLTKERLLHDAPKQDGRPAPSCARLSSSTSRASTTRPGCTRRWGCAPRSSTKPTTPPATPTASRARARARARAKKLCTTFGCAQPRRQQQPDSTKPGEVQLFLVRKRSSLKHRIHAQLLAFGHACPVSDLFGRQGRELLARLEFPDPWRGGVLAAVAMIDDLECQIAGIDRELRSLGADHRYIPLLMTVPGIAWVLGYTIAAEIGDIDRFASPKKLTGYTGLCPRVYQSGTTDRRGHLTHAGPKYLRWALIEAATHACRHDLYRERYQRNKQRLGKQRGAKVAQVDIARRLAEAIWHMLTRNQPFAPAGATLALAAH